MEVTAAIRSEDHTQFVSYFPTHQDGSCNGLQHYAALGRDQAGAESVNLSPFTHPQDVYSDVVELVSSDIISSSRSSLSQGGSFITWYMFYSLYTIGVLCVHYNVCCFASRWRKSDRGMLKKDLRLLRN